MKAETSALSLQRIAEYFNLNVPVTGTLDGSWCRFKASPLSLPLGSDAPMCVSRARPTISRILGDTTLKLDMADQRLKATLASQWIRRIASSNEADSTLPETFNDFDKVRLNLKAQSRAVSPKDRGALNLPSRDWNSRRLVVSFQASPLSLPVGSGNVDVAPRSTTAGAWRHNSAARYGRPAAQGNARLKLG